MGEKGGIMVVLNPGSQPIGDMAVGLQMVRKIPMFGWEETVVEYDEATGSHKYIVNKMTFPSYWPCCCCCYPIKGYIGNLTLANGPGANETTVKYRGHMDHHCCCKCLPGVLS